MENVKETRSLPEKIDVYVVDADGNVAAGAGYVPCVFINEEDVGRLYDRDVAQYIFHNYGSIVGVMRDTKFSAIPREFKTHKMILGKITLP